jgi:hypothetical protein
MKPRRCSPPLGPPHLSSRRCFEPRRPLDPRTESRLSPRPGAIDSPLGASQEIPRPADDRRRRDRRPNGTARSRGCCKIVSRCTSLGPALLPGRGFFFSPPRIVCCRRLPPHEPTGSDDFDGTISGARHVGARQGRRGADAGAAGAVAHYCSRVRSASRRSPRRQTARLSSPLAQAHPTPARVLLFALLPDGLILIKPERDRIFSRMPPSDLDIYRSAHLWIQTHGEHTTAKAREMVEVMREKGDKDGVDTWLTAVTACMFRSTRPRAPPPGPPR